MLTRALVFVALSSLFTVPALRPALAKPHCGHASWYALDGRTTANGERMSSKVMTAAHKSLPFGTQVRVTNLHNKRSVVVRINDRGPFIGGRVIDVTRAAAVKLGFHSGGVARVALSVVGKAARRHNKLCS